MIDSDFFNKACDSMTLDEICSLSGARLAGGADGKVRVSDLAPLDRADQNQISFLENKKYLEQFKSTNARACFVAESMVEHTPNDTICLISDSPYMAYALTAQAFYPIWDKGTGISENALIDKTAVLGQDVTVEAGAVIKAGVQIGDNTVIGANTVIERKVSVGTDCHIAPLVTLTHCHLGDRVSIATGARIGQPGFGFAMSSKGYVSVPQLGRVIIEDDVDIGANTTIDRGTVNDTIIRKGTRIDNLVQLGHNVETGNLCVIVAQTGISGSTKLGDYVVTGGQAGLAGHLKIASGTRIAAQSGVMKDIEEPGEYMGTPVLPLRTFMRQVATLKKMVSSKKGK